jgi:hypothetical protein
MTTPLIEHLRLQGAGAAHLGSPFSAALLEKAAANVEAGGPVAAAFAPWAGKSRRQLFAEAVALRWLAAPHYVALAEPDGPLAGAYPRPGRSGDPESAWPLILELIAARAAWLADFMAHEPQTNEVRRSAVLLPGFLAVAAETDLPLSIFELGASAGLNQLWDRRLYRLGDLPPWGPTDARVVIDAEWRGGPPPLAAPVRVAARAACDRSPVDLADPAARRRLRAYVWADQFDRLRRLEAAMAEALAANIAVERADAPQWTRRHGEPRAGLATVVFHSVFFQYMPAESQAALVATLAEFGAQARADAPLAWLRMEPAADSPAVMELRLTLWPGGEERLLAHAHPHGAWVEWAPSP